ncbi:hypothetical protein BN946_scf184791.g35 [Trametes cinnabarina]|uniref:AMP-dependent synthetase/ligase domain-containing protein n=1 Tax=Pycnoporus cinnabarinus TaxID=5643 RepID=A0A060S526_PYCCI|nr:hypothetical protein BN946_scf184791.g35 [Trametes cinnabarina]
MTSPRPTPQGVSSTTFNAPPLQHGLSPAGLYQYHAQNSPEHAAFTYADPVTRQPRDIPYAEAWDRIKSVAGIVSRNLSGLNAASKTRPVIAILALADTLSYIYLTVAITSLGYTAFPLSPRNSAVVTAHLLEVTATVQLYASADIGMQTLARDAIDLLGKKGLEVQVVPMVTEKDYSSPVPALPAVQVPVDTEDNDVAIILHSSGTTAMPKPIPITRRGLNNLANIPCFGEVDLAGKRIAVHTNPTSHAMGLATWILTSGATMALYPPISPPAVPTPANFLEAWVACRCDIVFCVPVFIEVYCGASVNKGIGDMLASSGVTLHPFWGSTEVGPATMFIPRDPPPAHEWDYFKISNHLTLHMELQEGYDHVYEPIHIPTETCSPHVTNSQLDGKPVFAVGDLLEQHPADPNRWRVLGRKDDQIMLSTAENVNPVPIGRSTFSDRPFIAHFSEEGMLVHDQRIASALLFGRSRIEPGVLIEPAPGHNIDPDDKQQLDAYINSIWPTIEQTNARFPAYAHIKRNMIIVTSPNKPLEYTAKGTPRRGVCLRLYEDEIDSLYSSAADTSPQNQQFPDRM